MKIWGRTTSSNVQKVMWAIGEMGLEHERIDIGGPFGKNKEPAYLAMNPNAIFPAEEIANREGIDIPFPQFVNLFRARARFFGELTVGEAEAALRLANDVAGVVFEWNCHLKWSGFGWAIALCESIRRCANVRTSGARLRRRAARLRARHTIGRFLFRSMSWRRL